MSTRRWIGYFSKFSPSHFSHINNSIHRRTIMAVSKSDSQKKASKRASQIWKISDEERSGLIAKAAYYRAEQRSFQNGDPVTDWLAAEAEIDEKLVKKTG